MFCPNCGAEVDSSWNACPSCGTKLHDDMEVKQIPQPQYQPYSQPYTQPYPSQAAPSYYSRPAGGGNTNGLISLILGIIGCCCGGLILGIIAIVFGIRGRQLDDEPNLATIGLILGVLDIIFGIISMVILLTTPGLLY